MFTGLIEDLGKITDIISIQNGKKIIVETNLPIDEIKIGDSISINGACQTVIKIDSNKLTFEAMAETLSRTNFNDFKKGDIINLERAMALNSRFDGHFVSGHIDCIATLLEIKNDGLAKIFKFECDTNLIIEKGSISINGISLTISKVEDNYFEVSILPYTLDNTNLKTLKTGDNANIEYDMIGKYIKKFVNPNKKKEITREFLIENGF